MKNSNSIFKFEPIGFIETCFKEKFGIPRQSGLVKQAKGVIQLRANPDLKTALRELDGFSHLWLIFVFHEHGSKNWKPSIRPPRLGGARKVGVLASRSPHRPNPIGISVVELEKVELDAKNGPRVYVRGVDLLDGTPILDIKPYLPYADSVPDARPGWAGEEIPRFPVEFTVEADRAIHQFSEKLGRPDLKALIFEMLSLDPRPAAQKRRLPADGAPAEGTRHGFMLLDLDVKWQIRGGKFVVFDVVEFQLLGKSFEKNSSRRETS